jgi:hypothetical protein
MLSLHHPLQQLTVAFAVGGAAFFLLKHRSNPRGRTLEATLAKLLAASAVPTGIWLLGCAFDASLLAAVQDAGLYMAAAGISLLFVALKELLK